MFDIPEKTTDENQESKPENESVVEEQKKEEVVQKEGKNTEKEEKKEGEIQIEQKQPIVRRFFAKFFSFLSLIPKKLYTLSILLFSKLKTLIPQPIKNFLRKIDSKLPKSTFIKFGITGSAFVVAVLIFVGVLYGAYYLLVPYVISPQNLDFAIRPTSVSASVFNDQENIDLEQEILITFEQNPNVQLLQEDLRENVDELISVNFVEEGSNQIALSREGGWLPDSTYNINFRVDKFPFLTRDYSLSFKTKKTPQVDVTNVDEFASIKEEFIIGFNTNVFGEGLTDPQKVLVFEPKIEGTVEVMSPTTLRFRPTSEVLDQPYKVVFNSGNIINDGGLQMAEDRIIDFEGGAVDPYNRQYVSYIHDAILDPRAGTQDELFVVVNPDIDLESFKEKVDIQYLDGVSLGTTVTSTRNVTYKEVNSLIEDFYIWPRPTDNEQFTLVGVKPNENWKKDNSYNFIVQEGLKNKEGVESTSDWSRRLLLPTDFFFRSSNVENGTLSERYYGSAAVTMQFSNELVYSNEELKDFIKVEAITTQPREIFHYTYVSWIYNEQNSLNIEADFFTGDRYRVTILPGLEDKYGNKLNQTIVKEFTVNAGNQKAILNIFGSEIAYVDNNSDYKMLVESRFLNNINVEVAKYSPEEFIHIEELLRYPQRDIKKHKQKSFEGGQTVKQWTKTFEDFDTDTEIRYGLLQFQYDLSDLEDGLYIMRAEDSAGQFRDSRLIVVSSYATVVKSTDDKTLAWVIDTFSGEPLSNQQLTLRNGGQYRTAVTDGDGVAMFTGSGEGRTHIYTQDGRVFSANDYQRGIDTYKYVNYNYGYGNEPGKYVYFDRPIYNAGEEVHFKVFARDINRQDISLPTEDLNIEIRDPNYNTIYEATLGLTDFGNVYDSFVLDEDLNSGIYVLSVNDRQIGGFRVASFQALNFSFTTDVGEKQVYSPSEIVKVDVNANYYFGEPLINADVEVNLYIKDENILGSREGLGDYPGYSFPGNNSYYYNQISFSSEKVGTATGTTDGNGNAVVEVSMDVPERLAYGYAKDLSVEVIVRDDLGSEQFKTEYRTLAPKGGRIGLRSDSRFVNVNDEVPFRTQAIILGDNFEPSVGEEVILEMYRIDRSEVKKRRANGVFYWSEIDQETLIQSTRQTSDADGKIYFEFKPDLEAEYRLDVKKANNPEIRHSDFYYAYEFNSRNYDYYSSFNNNFMTLETDKEEYSPGETARVTPVLPDNNYKALITRERGTIIDYKVVDMRENPSLTTFVDGNLFPNFYYSVAAFAPQEFNCEIIQPEEPTLETQTQEGEQPETDQVNTEENQPKCANTFIDFKLGIESISIKSEGRSIETEITTDKERYYPQETVKINVDAKQDKELEYMVAVVDKAVLDLSKISNTDGLLENLIDAFWQDWNLEVKQSTPLTMYENKAIAEKQWGNKGGSGDGGGPGFNLQIEDIRREFKANALWIPATVSANGDLELEFEAPDNLTTWSVVAVGMSKDTSFAVDTAEIIVANDVNIIAGLPQFLYQTDESTLLYNVNVKDNIKANPITTKIEVDNAEIQCGEEFASECQLDKMFDEFPIEYNIRPKSEGEVAVRFGVSQNNQLLDAEERKINVYKAAQDRLKEYYSDTTSTERFQFEFPEGHDQESKILKVVLSDKALPDVSTLKRYFVTYENKCSEQTSSTIKALVPYGSEDRVKDQIEAGIQRLYVLQNSDGGWGVWSNNQSVDFNSISAFTTLKHLQDLGYDVDQERLNNAENYISSRLLGISEERLMVWSMLADVDKFDISGVNNIYGSDPNNFNLLDRAYLLNIYIEYLQSDQINDGERAQIQQNVETITDSIMSEVRYKDNMAYWQVGESEVNRFYYNNDVKTTAIILDTLLDVKGSDKSLVPIINYLKFESSNRDGLGTQTNLHLILALTKAMDIFELDLFFAQPVVDVNGDRYSSFRTDENGNRILEIELPNDQDYIDLGVASRTDSLIFYKASVEYSVPFRQLPNQDDGLAIYMEYFDADDNEVQQDEDGNFLFKRGAVYKAKVTVLAKDNITQTEVRLPMSAGVRPIDLNLNLTDEKLLEEQNSNYSARRFFENLAINEKDAVFYTGDQQYGTQMQQGVYEFEFFVRANTKGTYIVPGEWMKEMYLPGRGAYQDSYKVKVL